ncbi:MAG TPA: hypothetical protein VFI47_28590 [Acidimicrobiales bacterium]|nr:hypothetical protein [Acidimicrobiales bacterium]
MTTAQLEYTAAELLADHPVAEPLIAGGRVCHGGFRDDGAYVSPRTLHRVPAIDAWQANHRAQFGTDILDTPLDTWPGQFPNVDQARFLVRSGVPEPLIASLTRIGTVEGLGANIRHLHPGDLQRHFVEDIGGTAIAHLGKGLFEAHGRDEAGWEEEAGHKDMWFAARDLAFAGRTAEVDIDAMLARMGFGQAGPGQVPPRVLPDDIDANLELIAGLMVRVLLIEIQAFHTFAWAEAWLSDRDLVAGDGAAATLVSHIRADESPHVGYLRTALTEMRDRTWIGASGRRYAGTAMVGALWDRALAQSLGENRAATRAALLREVEHWCRQRPDGDDVLAGFHSLATPEAAA